MQAQFGSCDVFWPGSRSEHSPSPLAVLPLTPHRFCTEAFRRGFFVYRGGANFEIRRERSYNALLRSIFA